MNVSRPAEGEDIGTYDIKTSQEYHFHAGFRQYPRGATASVPSTVAGDSTTLMFMFDGATSTVLGLSAIATTILVSMF